MGVVYILQVHPDGPIKIGTTVGNVYMRVQQLQQASPYELKWIGAFLGGREDESAAHRLLADHRLRGEWFFPTKAVRDFIAEKCGAAFTPEDFLDRFCFRRERDLIRAALRRNRRSWDELERLAGVSWGLVNWHLYLSPPPKEAVERMLAAIPELEALPTKQRRKRVLPGPVGPLVRLVRPEDTRPHGSAEVA